MSAAENVLVLVLLTIIIVPVLLVGYAYTREESGDLEYALSYWFGGIGGLFFYREYRQAQGDRPDSVRLCPECQSDNSAESDFCSSCGEELTPAHEVATAPVDKGGGMYWCGHCETELGTDPPNRCEACGRAVVT